MPGTVVKLPGNVQVKRRSARLRAPEAKLAKASSVDTTKTKTKPKTTSRRKSEPEEFSFSDVEADSGDEGSKTASNDHLRKKKTSSEGIKENSGAAAVNSRKRKSAAEVLRQTKAARSRKQPQEKPRYPKGIAFPVDEAMLISDGSKLGEWVHQALETILNNELQALEDVYTGDFSSVLDDLRQSSEKVLRRVHKEFTGKSGAALDDQMERPQPKANPKNQQLRQREAELKALIDDYRRELEEWKRVEEARCQKTQRRDRAKKQQASSDNENKQQEAAIEKESASKEASRTGEETQAAPPSDFDEAFHSTLDKTVAQLQVLNARLRGVKALALAGRHTSKRLAHRVDKGAFEAYKGRDKPSSLIRALASENER
ncbi:Hypothetical Protein FCC1311_000822 [Hondaea fermentalgiana]|uniref:Uncharacterized protein n=1 Tax=Hondaea fermentalgiana TaxID=2315210 RepID=A0A2R5FYN1_9STRA|nr:Hypothetical Protein FCC1311_000822 [Hondaea fermentalgiana]|eukprot:GBG23862.1 Hypothetical Protein FCC1311_000822 [Hondaea fermentalgiana]